MKPELLFDIEATLGESPVWDRRTQTLYWVDILNKRIYSGSDILVELDDLVGCVAPRKSGGLVLTNRSSFASLDLDSLQLTPLSALNDEPPTNRFNDGKCDSWGRFLAGTMNMGEKGPTGSLYSFDGKSITKLISHITISNGMTWSPDYKTFYYIDTPTSEVKAFDYDLETGEVANPRGVISIPLYLGWPDGMTSDMQGNLWIAMWGGAQVTKWNPSMGRLLEQIPVPAMNVSSVTFGGRDLNELYITSARLGLDETSLSEYPLTGSVFRLQTRVEGMPTFEFAG